MEPKSIDRVIQLADKLGHIFVATADTGGLPHLAAAAELRRGSGGRVSVAAWFCPGTLANLENNKKISLVVWDAPADRGFQLLGKVEQVEELTMLDGFAPGIEARRTMPQVERRLHVRVDKVIGFSHAPHSDIEDG